MRAVLLAVALTATGTIHPARLRIAPCATFGRGASQGTGTEALFYAEIRTRRARCTLRGSLTLIIEQHGRRLGVRGNPASVNLGGFILDAGHPSAGAGFWWDNWCGAQTATVGVVRLNGLVEGFRFATLPKCLDVHNPSTLRVDHAVRESTA